MVPSAARRHGIYTVGGGVLWVAGPELITQSELYRSIAVLIPVAVLFGVLELYLRYRELYGTAGAVGIRLVTASLLVLEIAFVGNATLSHGFVKVFVVGLPAVTGAVGLTVGSAILAFGLAQIREIPRGLVIWLGSAAPVSLVVNTVLTPILGFGVGLTGLAWATLGVQLARTERGWTTARTLARSPPEMRIQIVVAGLVGAVVTVVGVGGWLPLGPISGTPFVGQSIALDLVHLAVGVGGLGAAISGEKAARSYNRLVGTLFLVVPVYWALANSHVNNTSILYVPIELFRLNLTDFFFHVPIGLVTAATGFSIPRFTRP